MRLNKSVMIITLSAFIITTGGCSGNNRQSGNGTLTGQTAQDDGRMSGQSSTGGAGALGTKDPLNILHHTNIQMLSSPYLSENVAAMDEVRAAKAVVTESNIYVAVQLKDHVIGHNTGQPNEKESTRNLQKAYDGILNDANRDAGQTESGNGGIRSGITGNSYDYYQGKDTGRPVQRSLNNSSIPPAVQQKIVEKVRSLSGPNIQHIFVSDDSKLFQAFSSYEQKAGGQTDWNGHISELNSMANEIFPTAEGTGAYGGSTSSGQTEHIRQYNAGPGNGRNIGTH